MKTLILLLCVLPLTAPPKQQPIESQKATQPTPAFAVGEVTGTEVNVRSGPSGNYYVVMRLSAGHRVVIVDRRPSWVAIAPPKGAYSLIAREYIDPDGENKGVVNGDRVWVRAGSDLSEQFYAKQVQLNEGMSVTIVGETETHYRIIPPKGAKLWISEDYVRLIEDTDVESGTAAEDTVAEAPPERPTPTPPATKATQPTQSAPTAPKTTGIKSGNIQKRIEAIESVLDKEFEKERSERDIPMLIKRFTPIAEQDDDTVAKHYARYRIQQLERVIQHAETLKKLQVLDEQWTQSRHQFLQQRTSLHRVRPKLTREFDVRGKFIISAAYSNPVGPRRYRLIDPDSTGMIPRTIAYVEIDPQSEIDPQAFLGRYVGVRARSRHLLESTVDRMLVYIAAEIVILEEVAEDAPQ
ncbi:MAG: SH3 domain-containing protein [Planctomycetota bacterium]|nr:SH3 domain-containing protein [Planctomycetota bacterium]